MKRADLSNKALLSEVIEAGQRRANALLDSVILKNGVENIRRKFIVAEFFPRLYAADGKNSHAGERLSRYGNYILPPGTEGQQFSNGGFLGKIRAENNALWWYLYGDFEPKTDNKGLAVKSPADRIWLDLVELIRELGMLGEAGGGIVVQPRDVDENDLAKMDPSIESDEDEKGYLDGHSYHGIPHWLRLYQRYEEQDIPNSKFEIRPAWFFISSGIFLQIPGLLNCQFVLPASMRQEAGINPFS